MIAKRLLVCLVVATGIGLSDAGDARAQAYPNHALKIVVPYPPGGPTGVGCQPHVRGEFLKLVGGVTMTHIPYRGSAPAITDLLAGQIQMMFDTPVVMLPHIEAGKMRALAITAPARSPQLPDVPTMNESGLPRLEATLWSGMLAPAGTPASVVARLNATFNEGMNSPDMKASLAKLGAEPRALSPDAFARFLAAETQRWAAVVAEAGIKPE